MAADSPQNPAPFMPPRQTWWEWLKGLLFWEEHNRMDDETPPKNYRPTLGDRKSPLPPSSLADAYAKHAAETLGEGEQPPPPAKRAPAAAWKVVEPPASPDSVPHVEWKLELPEPGWMLIGASVRGKQHAHQGTWRDDSFAWGWAGPWKFIAVSDGAGSASLSRVGSRLACAAATKSLGETLITARPDEKIRLEESLVRAARDARIEIRNESLRRTCDEKEFHATLLLAALAETPRGCYLGVLQVGDGAVAAIADGLCIVIGEADSGAYSGETRFLTTFEIDEQWERRITLQTLPNVSALALMTDGVADDFFPESERLIELFEGNPIDGLKSADGSGLRGLNRGLLADPRGGEALADWLGYEKRGSFDDRTLVVLRRA